MIKIQNHRVANEFPMNLACANAGPKIEHRLLGPIGFGVDRPLYRAWFSFCSNFETNYASFVIL